MKLARTGLSPSAGGLSRPFRFASRSRVAVLQPRRRRNAAGLGFSPFARHYWGNHSCFLFLQVLRCFSSLRSPHHKGDASPSDWRVVPFGNPRVNGHLRLDGAYRSLSRPSSPPRAQASTMCPFYTSCRFSFPLPTPESQGGRRAGEGKEGQHTSGFLIFALLLTFQLVSTCQ